MVKCKYEGTGIWNGRCTGTKEVDPCPGYDKCEQYNPDYTTNADRFRAMSDEEQQKCVRRFWEIEDFAEWLRQPIEGHNDQQGFILHKACCIIATLNTTNATGRMRVVVLYCNIL